MTDLVINGGDLEAARRQARTIIDAFAGAQANADEAAKYVGHNDLASHVRHFAGQWDIKRGRLSKSLEELEFALNAVAETFADLDRDFTRELAGKAKQVPAGARGR